MKWGRAAEVNVLESLREDVGQVGGVSALEFLLLFPKEPSAEGGSLSIQVGDGELLLADRGTGGRGDGEDRPDDRDAEEKAKAQKVA